MNHSESISELAAALCAAQAEFGAIPKDSVNPFFNSKYAGLPSIVKATTPVLAQHGLAITQLLGYDTMDTLETMLIHESGQYISETMRLHLSKDDAQGQGSAVTYARRYSYMAILGLVADDDDDGNAAAKAQAAAPEAKPDVREDLRKYADALVAELEKIDKDGVRNIAPTLDAAQESEEQLRNVIKSLATDLRAAGGDPQEVNQRFRAGQS